MADCHWSLFSVYLSSFRNPDYSALTHRSLIERLGKYIRFAQPGFHWIIPNVEKIAAIYFATATETAADRQKPAQIKKRGRYSAGKYLKGGRESLGDPVGK